MSASLFNNMIYTVICYVLFKFFFLQKTIKKNNLESSACSDLYSNAAVKVIFITLNNESQIWHRVYLNFFANIKLWWIFREESVSEKMKNLWKSSNENQRNDKEEDCVKRGTSAGWDLRQRMWGAVAKNMSFLLYNAHMWLAVTDETQLQ